MDGRPDLDRAARELAERIPEPLAPLARLAYNYRWSWHPDGPGLFEAIDADRWRRCLQNPVRLLEEAPMPALHRAAGDAELLDVAHRLESSLREEFERPLNGDAEPDRPVAFLCAEYGIHVSLPVYSGGLGALAGDLVKEASDRALPLVAIGLMYRQGYFRQRIDASGWQHEYWIDTDPERLPAALVRGENGHPVKVNVPVGERGLHVQIWRVQVGRVPLFLLDTAIPENEPLDHWISSRLYVGDPGKRLPQYVVLGVGGMRALQALGIRPGTLHLNEGHAALAPLEAAREEVADGMGLAEALESVRARTVFTTH